MCIPRYRYVGGGGMIGDEWKGKGSVQRGDADKYAENWEKIFGSHNDKDNEQKQAECEQ